MKSVTTIFRRRIDRRTLLKGASTTLALPLLDAMTPALARGAEAATPPQRMVAIQTNQGIMPQFFFPETAGRDYEETDYLKQLSAHREDMTVFSDPSRCELRAPLAGPARVSKEGQALLVQRLESLDRAKVEAIFRAARFDRMDQRQLERLRDEGASDPGEAAIREWTDTFMQRIEEVKSARGCVSLPR